MDGCVGGWMDADGGTRRVNCRHTLGYWYLSHDRIVPSSLGLCDQHQKEPREGILHAFTVAICGRLSW